MSTGPFQLPGQMVPASFPNVLGTPLQECRKLLPERLLACKQQVRGEKRGMLTAIRGESIWRKSPALAATPSCLHHAHALFPFHPVLLCPIPFCLPTNLPSVAAALCVTTMYGATPALLPGFQKHVSLQAFGKQFAIALKHTPQPER